MRFLPYIIIFIYVVLVNNYVSNIKNYWNNYGFIKWIFRLIITSRIIFIIIQQPFLQLSSLPVYSSLGKIPLSVHLYKAKIQRVIFVVSFLFISSSCVFICSVQFSRSVLSDSWRPHEPRHPRPPGPSLTPTVHPNSSPLSR